jgi:hypothetical protein
VRRRCERRGAGSGFNSLGRRSRSECLRPKASLETPGGHGEAAPGRLGLEAGPGGPTELALETGRELLGILRAAAVRDDIAGRMKDL